MIKMHCGTVLHFDKNCRTPKMVWVFVFAGLAIASTRRHRSSIAAAAAAAAAA